MNLSLQSSLTLTYDQLTTLSGVDFWHLFNTAFGTQYNHTVAESLRLQWQAGDFSQLPQIEILDSSVLGDANGAYAISTNKIYLSANYVATSTPENLVNTLLEEIGHFVDAQINLTDSPGDEGAIFAELIQGYSLDTATLQALKTEDDHATITINGQVIQVEQQNFTGTNGNDTITGTSGDDVISPLRGQDTVDGGAGNDLLIVDYSSNTYIGTSPQAGIGSYFYGNGNGGFNGSYTAYYNSSYDYDQVNFSNIERFQITGTVANDNIITGDGNDTINAGAGDDVITAGAGINVIDGGAGIDTLTNADFSSATTAFSIDDSNTAKNITLPNGTTVTNIERFTGLKTGSGNDVINFSQRSNDTFSTGNGDDTINTGLGQDTIDGGAGNDLLIVDYSSNTYIGTSPQAGIGSYFYGNGNGGFNGSYTAYYNSSYDYDQVNFSNIERFQITGTVANDNIITGDGNDTINAGAGDDVITAGAGINVIDGGAGIDTLTNADFSSATTAFSIDDSNTAKNITLPNGTTVTNIERFTGLKTGSGNDVINFSQRSNDTLSTGNGDDTINTGLGQDTVDGGVGNDLLIVDYSSNTYIGTSPQAGIGSYFYGNGNGGFNGSYTAYYNSSYDYDQVNFSNIERFQITGTVANDNIITGDGNDTINAGAGDDVITAGAGINVIDGGAGIDTLTNADFSSATTAFSIDDSNTAKNITLPNGTTVTNIERFTGLKTGSGNDVINFSQRINDTLSTGNGDDTINTGLGQDTVDGGVGNDLLIVDYSSNTYIGTSPQAGIGSYFYGNGNGGFNGSYTAYYNSSYDYDQVNFSNIERFQITGTVANDNITTGDGNDTINGGAGNDTINAGGGNDTLIGVNPNNINPGKGEIDTLTGGTGSDRFILGDADWIGYDDGLTNNAGTNDYAQINDFNSSQGDILQLKGVSTDYLLAVSGADTQILINKPGAEPDELIGIIKNQTGLSLTGNYFVYVQPSITLAVEPTSVTEDGTANLIYTFTRTGTTNNPLTVNYTITGTADSSDYTGATPGTGKTITFAANSATATLTIDPTADSIVEPDETVTLTLASGTGYNVGTNTAITGTILNDDTVIESAGNTSLIKDGVNKYSAQAGNTTPIAIKNGGQQIYQNIYTGWQTLAVETVNGDNQVLWKNTNGNFLHIWHLDNNWNLVSSEGQFALNSAEAFTQETNFGIDANGDGVIGNVTPIESAGNTKLVKDSTSKYFTQIGTATPTAIKNGGQQIYENIYTGWQTIAAETINGDNQVLWKNTNGNFLHIWHLDNNWNLVSSEGQFALNSTDAITQETNFQIDANGDGFIGNPYTLIESAGNTKLVKDNTNKYFTQIGTATPTVIKNGGQQIYQNIYAGWQTIAAETVNGDNQVLWKNTNGNYLHIWHLDNNWNLVSAEGQFALNSADAFTQETNFGIDANGDGIIGNSYTPIESVGNTSLVKDTTNKYYAQLGTATPTAIKNGGQQIYQNIYAGWQTIAAETVNGDNQVLWKNTNGNFLHIWHLDNNWNLVSAEGQFALDSSDALIQESKFQIDANGDGQIGYGIIENSGNSIFLKDATNKYYAQTGNTTPIAIKNGGQQIYENIYAGWQTLAAETVNGQNQVLWKNISGNYLHVWKLDSNWNWTSSEGQFALNSPQVLTQEANFQMDLNGDGLINIETAGNTPLSLGVNGYLLDNNILLKYNGNGVTDKTFDSASEDWNLLGVEKTGTGYQGMWRSSLGSYSPWNIDNLGNYVSSTTVSLAGIVAYETTFAQDFNNNGAIGS